jgi:D-3-phosphoglycerate dehydrogenase
MKRIVLTGATFPDFKAERSVAERHGADFARFECKSANDVTQAAANADVLLVQFAPVTREAIASLASGSAIVRYGIGLDNIDLSAAREFGVRVAYVPDYATGEVADHSATLILASLRKLFPLDRSVREGNWDPVGIAEPMPSFAGSVLGFVGFGRIGREVLARLRPFGFTALICDPFVDPDQVRALGAEVVDDKRLFAEADAISLHCPLSKDTHHLVDADKLTAMKPTAVIVNTARGALIDPEALTEALSEGRIAAAALDVFEDEPLPMNSPLREAPNLILTPHVAWYSAEAAVRVQQLAADEVDRHLSGRPARCAAPPPVGIAS